MEKEFAPYIESAELKELDFNEPCLGVFPEGSKFAKVKLVRINSEPRNWNDNSINGGTTSAPTLSQAFRWFREKYGLVMVIKPIDDKRLELGYNITKNGLIIKACTTYEEAELACLRKLIEIVKTK